MGWIRYVGVILILLIAIQPVHPAASATIHESPNTESPSGPITIESPTDSGVTSIDSNDIVIDATGNGQALGLPVDGIYTYGNLDAPSSNPAFVLTNRAAQSHDITLSYESGVVDPSTVNIRFSIYDADGNRVSEVTEEDRHATITAVSPDESLFVVVVINTHGLSINDDLSGTVTVRVA